MSRILNYEALDIETIWVKKIAKPICIAITDGDSINFKMVDVNKVDEGEIIDFMLEKCLNNKIYYVHNLTFEIFVFLKYLIKKKIKFKITAVNKIVYAAEIHYKEKKIKMKCSYRITMLSLRKLSEMAGIEEKGTFPYSILDIKLKDKMDIKEKMFKNKLEYENFMQNYRIERSIFKILKQYCENDAMITKKSIINFWEIILKGGLKNNGRILTAAKLSITNFFMLEKNILKKIDLKYDETLRPYYFGGRVEVFGNLIEEEVALHYDWSGMYAQCMEEKVLGGKIKIKEKNNDVESPGFYWIEFEQNLEIPILPIKEKKLLFANGKFEGWYWFEEIKLAIEYGVKILKIGGKIYAEKYDYFIKNFVKINNNIRKISPLHKLIGKNNNNTFYGRLGMNPKKTREEILSKEMVKNMKNKYDKIIKINNVYLCQKEIKKTTSNITISAAITAKARIKLYKGIMEVIKKEGRILYTDTDSIIAAFNKKNINKVLNKEIGEIFFDSKKEDTVIKDAVFALPKTYAIIFENNKEVVKIKGFNNKPKFEEFKKKFYKKQKIITKNEAWSKKDFCIKLLNKKKETNLNSLDKRIWSQDLKTTSPLKMDTIIKEWK